MILYHGSNTKVEAVDLSRCRPNKDFGQGFYLTPDKSAAEKMALRTVRRFGGTPFLMTYDFDEAQLEKLNQKLFEVPSVE
ncbi:MAG: DUF3990 domain-containing protein, partial [Kiritimatiellae bacterium]|nr:DUF3990 domain-containing protein [Kiritimatiellia bacterium]